MQKVHIFLICLAVLSGCASTIKTESVMSESDDLAQIANDIRSQAEKVGSENVLVVLDIDNTLLAMDQGLGADQWYDWQKELAEEDPCDPRIAPDRFAAQGALYYASAMRPTQPEAPGIVSALQDEGFRVIALTSRGVNYRLQTFRELRRNGYSFAYSAIGPEGGLEGDFTPPSGSRPAQFEDGVFLTSGQHKGDMLKDLLDLTNTPYPLVVVMVDDKQKNLDNVVETMTRAGIATRAWRYTAEDANVAAFDEDAANELWNEIEPALRTLQEALGPDHFNLPAPVAADHCSE